MNIRARERARLSQGVPRPSASSCSSFARLNYGRSHAARETSASFRGLHGGFHFAANAFRCVLSHYAWVRSRLHACTRYRRGYEAKMPTFGDLLSLYQDPRARERFGYTRDVIFFARRSLNGRYLNDSSVRHGANARSTPNANFRLFFSIETVVLFDYIIGVREKKCA